MIKSNVEFLAAGTEDWVALPIKLQPGFSAAVHEGAGIDVSSLEDVKDAYDPKGKRTFPNSIYLDLGIDLPTHESVAVEIWAARAVSEFHEILEFIEVDGQRLAEPHPGGWTETEMWAWLHECMSALATEYIKRYPIE